MSPLPYRVPHPPPDGPRLPPAPGIRARKTATLSALPQIVLALTFVLPTFYSCDRSTSALDESRDSLLSALIAVPVFAIALLLACITLYARARRRPPRAHAAFVAVVMYGLGWGLGVLVHAVTAAPFGPDDFGIMLGAAAVVALGVFAIRRKGWSRVAWLGASHALASSVVALFAVSGLSPPENRPVLAGAVLFESSYAALVILSARWALLWLVAHTRRRGARS